MHNLSNSDMAGNSQTVRCSCAVTKIHTPFLTCSLPGVKKPLGQYGPAGVEDTTAAAPAAADEDDDDIDLFGSDEEEVSSGAEEMACFDRIAWSHDDFSHHLSADCCDGQLFLPENQLGKMTMQLL